MLRNFQPALTIVDFKICYAHFKKQLVNGESDSSSLNPLGFLWIIKILRV